MSKVKAAVIATLMMLLVGLLFTEFAKYIFIAIVILGIFFAWYVIYCAFRSENG